LIAPKDLKIGWFSLGVFVVFFGCGQVMTGTYVGNEVVTLPGGRTQQVPVTISITQNNNDVIVGTTDTGIYGSGALSGRPGGNVSDNYTLKNNYGTVLRVPVSCGAYLGKGVLSSQGFSVSLELVRPSPLPVPLPQNYPSISSVTEVCPTMRVIAASRQ
jgi:hypothetical protein